METTFESQAERTEALNWLREALVMLRKAEENYDGSVDVIDYAKGTVRSTLGDSCSSPPHFAIESREGVEYFSQQDCKKYMSGLNWPDETHPVDAYIAMIKCVLSVKGRHKLKNGEIVKVNSFENHMAQHCHIANNAFAEVKTGLKIEFIRG